MFEFLNNIKHINNNDSNNDQDSSFTPFIIHRPVLANRGV